MDLGKLVEHMPVYSDITGTELGAIDVHESGLRIQMEGHRFMIPLEYVESIVPERELALGKTQVRMVVYDVLGTKNELRFIISGVHLATLMRRCGKA